MEHRLVAQPHPTSASLNWFCSSTVVFNISACCSLLEELGSHRAEPPWETCRNHQFRGRVIVPREFATTPIHEDHITKTALAACVELPTSNYTQTARERLKPQDIAKFTKKGQQAIKLQGREAGAHSSSKDCGSASSHFELYVFGLVFGLRRRGSGNVYKSYMLPCSPQGAF